MDEPSADYDSPWKHALDLWLESFVKLFFPEVWAAIDWSVPPVPQDSELSQLFSEDESGRMHVDHLVNVRLKTGRDCDLFLHIEVQGEDREAFRRRMFGYRIRIHESVGGPVESLVLITEGGRTEHAGEYREVGIQSGIHFWYPVAWLADFWPRWRELWRSGDPIGLVVLAHLASQRSREKPEKRYNWKVRLTRSLLRAGHNQATLDHLLNFVDWLLRLPEELRDEYRRRRAELKEAIMGRPYVSQTDELILAEGRALGQVEGRMEGRAEGARSSLRELLVARFGPEAEPCLPFLDRLLNPGTLQELVRRAATCADIQEFRSALEGYSADGLVHE